MNITIATVAFSAIKDMSEVYREFKERYKEALKLNLFCCASKMKDEKLNRLKKSIEESDFVILDLMGADEKVVEGVVEVCPKSKAEIVTYGGDNRSINRFLKLGKLTAAGMGMSNKDSGKTMSIDSLMKMINMAEKTGKLLPFGKLKDMRNYIVINKYLQSAGKENIKNLFLLILRDYGGLSNIPKPEEPITVEDACLYNPENKIYYKSFEKYVAYNKMDKEKPTVAMIYYGHNYPCRTIDYIFKFSKYIEVFANVIFIANPTTTGKNMDKVFELLYDSQSQKNRVDMILNFMSFRFGAGPMGGDVDKSLKILKKLDVPIINPLTLYYRNKDEWTNNMSGLLPTEFLISIMLPELDGCIESIPVGAIKNSGYDSELDIEVTELDLIEDRALKLAGRIENILKLRKMKNSDKKIAIVCYNYPPGEGKVFGGAFLDTFKSIENILKLLKYNDYSLDTMDVNTLKQQFTEGKLLNSGKWTAEDYNGYIKYEVEKYIENNKNKEWYSRVEKQWGEVPGNVMVDGKSFLIPGILNQNVFIGVQPARISGADVSNSYHDRESYPHHQYIAFYTYLKEEFKADVIIHVGTHGTLEFLNGKECALSNECMPDYLIGEIPHVYLYYCGNPSEAVIAKRRSYAQLVSYQPPAFEESELYGGLAKLYSLIQEYYEAKSLDEKRCKEIERMIFQASEDNMIIGSTIEEIEKNLYSIKSSLIPKGLHVFGESYDREDALKYVASYLKFDREKIKSIVRIVGEKLYRDYDGILERNDVEKLDKINNISKEIVKEYIQNQSFDGDFFKCKKQLEEAMDTLSFGKRLFDRVIENNECEGLLKALSGRYIYPALAGDIIRNEEVLPTGYNLYQFDSRYVPSPSACKTGGAAAENTIKKYFDEKGTYPESAAVILWGLETSKTQGETIGQILYYLGVRLKNNKNVYHHEYEIIPYKELKRPRIDVVVNMCGFFRDMFPNVLNNLSDVIEKLANLDEPESINFIKKNKNRIYQKLIEKGYKSHDAEELSVARLFGPKEGEYGTEVTNIIESQNWQNENEIAESYTTSLKYAYTKNIRGKECGDALDLNLVAVDIVSQIRFDNEYEITDLDHYYEFYGGLSKSVERVKGEKAKMYISDSTGERIHTDTIENSISKGVSTRLLNPKWIDGMLKHDYNGVQKIAERFENILGLAATTGAVDNIAFDKMYDTYVKNEDLRKQLMDKNRYAYLNMLERLLECNKRGYWKALEEQLNEIRKMYIDIE